MTTDDDRYLANDLWRKGHLQGFNKNLIAQEHVASIIATHRAPDRARIAELEAEVERLRAEYQSLRNRMADVRMAHVRRATSNAPESQFSRQMVNMLDGWPSDHGLYEGDCYCTRCVDARVDAPPAHA